MGPAIYLYTDLEGVAGVERWDDRANDRPDAVRRRWRTRELLMGEINAAADGAFAGGAGRVVAVMGHSDSVIYELADERLEIITGGEYDTWLPDLGNGYDAAFFVGAHAMGGTPGATLAHSFTNKNNKRWWLCGREIGELGALAAIAGSHGVPLVLATGDDALGREARALIPGIETAQVKTSLGLLAARHLSKERAREAVRAAARRAAERAIRKEIAPFRPPGPPYAARVRVDTTETALPPDKPGEHWISPGEVEYTGDDLRDIMRKLTY